jgi:hypothetical protein
MRSAVGNVLGPALLPADVTGQDNPFKTVWLSLAITDTLLFHATVYSAAVHFELVTNVPILANHVHLPKESVTASAFHKSETLRLLGTSSSDEVPSDESIGALLLLTASEVVQTFFSLSLF